MAYKFNPFTGTLDYYESSSGAEISDGFIVEPRTLTALEATNKELTLLNAPPVPAKVVLDIVGGTSQEYSTDYVVTGSTLSWNGLGLDLTLHENDKIRIIYPI